MAASNLQVRPSDPQRDEPRRIDRLIGSLLHSLDILGAARLRVAAELEPRPGEPLTIDEILDRSRRSR